MLVFVHSAVLMFLGCNCSFILGLTHTHACTHACTEREREREQERERCYRENDRMLFSKMDGENVAFKFGFKRMFTTETTRKKIQIRRI